MANFLVIVELVDGTVAPSALEILGQARRMGTQLGATVFALLAMPQPDGERLDELGAVLGAHGADRVIAATTRAQEARGADVDQHWSTMGAQIVSIVEAVPPRLVLFAMTPAGREVAPRLAARLSAGYAHDGWFEIVEGHLVAGEGSSAFAADLDFPLVMTIGAGRYPLATASCPIEVDLLPALQTPADFDPIGTSVSLPSPLASPAPTSLRLGHIALVGATGEPVPALCSVAIGGELVPGANFAVAEPLPEVAAALSPGSTS